MKSSMLILTAALGALGACSDNRPRDVADCQEKAMQLYKVSKLQLSHDSTAIGSVLKCMQAKGYSPVSSEACESPVDSISWACFK